MELLLTGGAVFRDGKFVPSDVSISDGRIVSVSPQLPRGTATAIEVNQCWIVPGFVDVHVHLREPGFSYKETIASGTAAAAAGGYTAVCAMPNLRPVPDSPAHLEEELALIRRDGRVRVYPYGAISVGQRGEVLADLAALAPDVAGFSDDGRGVQSEELMRRAMVLARELDRPVVAHCEDERLLTGGWCVNAGACARRFGLPGNDPASEYRQVERDIALVREIGCRYHVCHISTAQSAALIRSAKAEGMNVTCETAPHYLLLCDEELEDDGRFKMNPPIRTAADRDALVEALADGTIDCIATDHAPHSAEEKSRGLKGSLNGVVGLEAAFTMLYTGLVETGRIPLSTLLDRLCVRPRQIFRLPGGAIEPGAIADLTVIDPRTPQIVDPSRFRSAGRATPFAGRKGSVSVALTLCGGEIAYRAEKGISHE